MRHPPVKPRPIRDDPQAGQYQVVVSFRTLDPVSVSSQEGLQYALEEWAEEWMLDPIDGLSVAVREIGAGGERSEQEGLGP